MSKKKARNKPPVQNPGPAPVTQGNVFATMLNEAQSLCNEVTARRQYAADLALFLAEKGLTEEWSVWLTARRG